MQGGASGEAQGLAQGTVRVSFQHGASVGGLDGGRDVGDVVGQEEAFGDARPSPYRVRSVAPGRRDWRARTRNTAMKTVPSAPVVSACSRLTERPPRDRARHGVLPVAGGDKAIARRAVEGAVALVANLREAEDELAQAFGRAAMWPSAEECEQYAVVWRHVYHVPQR